MAYYNFLTEGRTMNMQEYFDTLSKKWAGERSATQMTLCELIASLKQMDPEVVIKGLGNLHSYRGYYSDLAFDIGTARDRTVKELVETCKDAIDNTYEGWKGGDYVMGKSTPLFVAHEGSTGERLMAIVDGKIVTSREPD